MLLSSSPYASFFQKAPLAILDQDPQPVAFLVGERQGTEQARARGVHLGFLHLVIQLQIGEATAGDLNESMRMLQPRMPENHQPSVLPKSASRRIFVPLNSRGMSLDLTQEAFADLLGIGLSTLRSWEQKKREPSGAACMLIAIALKHPEVLREAVA